MKTPKITDGPNGPVLMADNRPFLILGGEVHNSSGSSVEYMEKTVFPSCAALGINTALVPVSWELTEPEEGRFDFSVVEGLIVKAREAGLKLVLLWFGLWKNGFSSYTPEWMKNDPAAYFRIQDRGGKTIGAVSPFCEKAVEKDARAFGRLMQEIKRLDSEENTVLMIQVENEIGVLGGDRDYGSAAEALFHGPMPAEAGEIYGAAGAWDALGADAAEIFMSYHYAKAIEKIAAAGKRAYNLPMYVNAWLEQFPERAGAYPSGGPVAKNMALWKRAAKSVDFLSPDIYVEDFEAVCREYSQDGNVLFIPEARCSADSASNIFAAFGQYDAIGFSPFAVEDLYLSHAAADAPLIPLIPEARGAFPYVRASYEAIANIGELILEHRRTGNMKGFTRHHAPGKILSFDTCDVKITYRDAGLGGPKGGGLVIALPDGAFLLTGVNYEAEFLPKSGPGPRIDLLRAEEGKFANGEWERALRLNGDEYGVRFGDMAKIMLCKVYFYE